MYINPELDKYWILDYRIYDKRTDGKNEHALEMIQYWQAFHELHPERAPFTTVLIDAGYTCKQIMQYAIRVNKYFFGVIPKSRKVSFEQTDWATGEIQIAYKHVSELGWEDKRNEGAELRAHGKLVCVGFLPKDIQLRLFLVTAKHRKEYLVTNQVSIETTEDAKKVGGFRWKIE